MFGGSKLFWTALLLGWGFCNASFACDRWLEAKNPKGIVLLTQGMNLKSEKLLPLAEFFLDQNLSVFLPSFQGHCQGRGSYLTATADDWLNDAEVFYREAKTKSTAKGVPLYLVAYSFSALLYELRSDLVFEKKVLFAPAFATHFWYPLVKTLANWFPHWKFRTKNLADHAVNLESSLHSVKVVGDLLAQLERKLASGSHQDVPSLLFIDPKDELVNADGVKAIADSRPLWRLEFVTNEGNPMPESFHHLIVTPKSVAEVEWKRMLGLMGEFF